MSLKINRIIDDLNDASSEIQMLALTMVPRLSKDMNLTPKELGQLSDRINKLMLGENQDVVFLARKASNFLAQLASPSKPRLAPENDPVHQSAEKLAQALATEKDATRLATILSGLRKLQDSSVLAQVKPHLTHADARVRANAVEVIEEAGTDADIALLVPLVEDENNRVRSNAIKALGKFGYPKVKEAIQQMLATDRLSMRESAVYAISHLPGLDAIDILATLINDSYEGVRRRVVDCLQEIPKLAAQSLLEKMLSDGSEAVRGAAAAALAVRGVDVSALLEKTRKDAEPEAQKVIENLQASVAVGTPAGPAGADKRGPVAGTSKVMADGTSDAGPAPVPVGGRTGTGAAPADASDPGASAATGAVPGEKGPVRGGAQAEDEVYERHAAMIAAELAGAERKAVLARALFALGCQSLQMCQTGRLKDTAALKEYYDAMTVLRNLMQCEAKVEEGTLQGLGEDLAQTGVDHYQGRLKVAIIRMGKVYLDLCRRGAITAPETPLLRKLLELV